MKFLRISAFAAVVATLPACGGGGLGNVFSNNPVTQCQTGTAQQLADPAPFSTTSNVNQITIVASDSNNALNQSPSNWSIYVVDSFGNQIPGGQLSPVPFRSGPHPYTNDFYYASQLQETLPQGQTWKVYLTEMNAACSAVPLQSFST
jgi:hypothetical protein